MSSYGFEEADPHEESVRINGRVKWFDAGKGYGFIVPDDPSLTGMKDVLLHVTSLRQAGREGALEGAVIICDVIKRPKGWQVADVVDLDESSAPPPSERPHRPFERDGGGFRRDRDSHDFRRAEGEHAVRAPRRPLGRTAQPAHCRRSGGGRTGRDAFGPDRPLARCRHRICMLVFARVSVPCRQ